MACIPYNTKIVMEFWQKDKKKLSDKNTKHNSDAKNVKKTKKKTSS